LIGEKADEIEPVLTAVRTSHTGMPRIAIGALRDSTTTCGTGQVMTAKRQL